MRLIPNSKGADVCPSEWTLQLLPGNRPHHNLVGIASKSKPRPGSIPPEIAIADELVPDCVVFDRSFFSYCDHPGRCTSTFITFVRLLAPSRLCWGPPDTDLLENIYVRGLFKPPWIWDTEDLMASSRTSDYLKQRLSSLIQRVCHEIHCLPPCRILLRGHRALDTRKP